MVNITPLFSTSDSIHQEYTSEQEVLIPSILSSSLFNPETDYVVFSLETINGDLLYTTQKARYVVRNVPNTITKKSTPEIITFPLEDIKNSEYSEGEYNVFYNFYRTALESDVYSFFIKEISPNRTEVRLSVNNVEDKKVEVLFNEFKTLLDDGTYFKDFYLNVGDYYYIATNTQLDTTTSPYTILFKTYQPLPPDVGVNSQVQVVFETAETYGFNVSIPITPITFDEEVEYIKGPNFNLGIIDEVNNSTFEQSYSSLVETPLTSSYNQIQNLLTQKGVTIDTDYTDFSNFIHFSSAQHRLLNFYYKVSLIESYNNDITTLLTITGSTSSSIAVTSSIQSIQNQITDLIKGFDGYENFLYYTSGAYAYPKSNSTPPYTLHSTGSNDVLTWLGSTNESSNVYGGILLSASTFDNQNQDYLYNSVPKYIKEDPINAGYELFISMVGQHFDNLYIYIDAITDRFDADNRVNYGIPKELVADALKSMGIKLYQNNFSSDDLYAAFLGINGSGSFLPPTGSEVITNYVTASNEPIPLNNLNLETYKRLYHNLPYLLKKKGTIEGLRALITCFGIPDTILRISEFGGKDKDNSNDWDYFQNKFNYALFTSGSDGLLSSYNGIYQFWAINPLWKSPNNRPQTLSFRFKPNSLPTSSQYQILAHIAGDNDPLYNTGYITLTYTGSGYNSSSYSGSIPSSSNQYATLTYWVWSGGVTSSIVSLDAPFYDDNWWSVSLSSGSVYTLRAANKIYDGNDGFKIGYTSFNSSSNNNSAWKECSLLFIPFLSASIAYPNPIRFNNNIYNSFIGSYQELRYYNIELSENEFYDLTMNPYSIEGSNYSSSANNLVFRAPLGSDLIITTGSRTSIHPKITGSFITNSFVDNSTYAIYNSNSKLQFVPNTEFIYYDQPAVGIRNRISEKIRIEDNIIPSGDTLTPYRSLQQRYPQSESYTRDVNYVEVAFSPQNEINDDINSSMGYFNIGEYIGDPRQVSESTYTYPDLDRLRDSYFSKYFKNYNWNDYIRLIKYFDNSLFKMIKDFTPARSGLATGVVIKQHLLERNRQRPAQIELSQHDYSGSVYSEWIWNDKISGSVVSESRITKINGGVGGAFDDLNNLGSSPEGQSEGVKNILAPYVTQSWTYEVDTKYGPQIVTQSTQDEFYNGELKGTEYEVTNGELNPSLPEYSSISSFLYPDPSASIDDSSPNGSFEKTNTPDDFYTRLNTLSVITNSITSSLIFLNQTSVGVTQMALGYDSTIPVGQNLVDILDTLKYGDNFNVTFVINQAFPPIPQQPLNVPYNFKIGNITKYPTYYIISFIPNPIFNPNPSSYLFNAYPIASGGGNIANIRVRLDIIPNNVYDLSLLEDIQPLQNNATEPRLSSIYQDIDYSNGLVPINISLLVSGTADKAPIQDSNYTSKGWTNSRYNGSRVSSTDFNV
jgi:hypothetical protein